MPREPRPKRHKTMGVKKRNKLVNKFFDDYISNEPKPKKVNTVSGWMMPPNMTSFWDAYMNRHQQVISELTGIGNTIYGVNPDQVIIDDLFTALDAASSEWNDVITIDSIPDWKYPIPTKEKLEAVSTAPKLTQKQRDKLNEKRALDRQNRKRNR